MLKCRSFYSIQRLHRTLPPGQPRRLFASFTADDTSISIPSFSATYPYVWLRDSCHCAACVHPSTRQKLHRSSDVPLDVRPVDGVDGVKAATEPDGLHVQWNEGGHRSFYPAAFLKKYSKWDPFIIHRDAGAERWKAGSHNLNLYVPYETLINPGVQLGAMSMIDLYGLLLIRGVSTTEKSDETCELRNLAKKFGEIRPTFYGETWDVRNVRNSKNIAYTNLHLGLHMDLLYFQSPPRYQILHCLRNRVEGGHSIFVDGYNAALELHEQHPKEFSVLATHPVEFQYINDGHHLHCSHPTIEMQEEHSEGPGVSSVKYINYSPPFQGPLLPSTPPAFYEALKKYTHIIEAPENRFEFLLQEGDAVVFDNRRVLHGRTAFVDTGVETEGSESETNRWLKGCYLDEDAFADKRRVMAKDLEAEHAVGNSAP